jgi:outer membrane protein assembly factor BamD
MKRFLPEVLAACLLATLAAQSPAGILPIHHKDKVSTKADRSNPSVQPDKVLYDKAMEAMKKNRFDVARLDLQTLLTTYPESEYQMQAKLAVGDTWFREGGTAALAQAEAEYKDFITFFPNQPEAAKAQMRVADIYYMQMEKPDRDPASAERAEAEYRTMIQQYPDSPLVPRAQQKLREVQEVLAERQYQIGSFYESRESWDAAIARLETVTERFPLYSRSDMALIDLGDAYRGEARYVQNLAQMPEKAKQELIKAYDDRAADAYDRVVTHYAMSAHVEDARERLIALNRPMPEATQQELAASEKLEQSRTGITLKDRAMFLVKRGPNTVEAARIGKPTIVDPPEVDAPAVNKQNEAMFTAALNNKPIPAPGEQPGNGPETASNNAAPAAAANAGDQDAGTLELQSVPTAASAAGPAIGASIVEPGSDSAGSQANGAGAAAAQPGFRPAGTAAVDPGAATAAANAGVPGAQNPGGLPSIHPDNAALPPIEKPAPAAPQINEVPGGAAAAQVETGTGDSAKKKAPAYKSGVESSSKHKKKTGAKKINPF